MKLPNFRRSAPPPPKVRSLRATAARMKPGFDEYEEEDEPTTRLSSAFIVVLVIHLVFVGGIYAFNGIKAHRRAQELLNAPVPAAAPKALAKPDTSADATYAVAATPAPILHLPPAAAVPAAGGRVYRAKAGDTLAKVATASNVSLADLASLNSLRESAPLHAGQTLALPAARRVAVSPAAPAADAKKEAFLAARDGVAPKTYTVRSGETSVGIARKLGVSQEELMKLNKIDDPKKLQINQVLKVPAKKTAAESAG